MSEIREKARSFLNHGAEINRHKLIHDLLTELERVENDTAKVKLAYAEGKITGRQQAARECIEIIDKYPAFLFGADAVGVKLNLSQSIKAHFAIKGE